MKKCKKIFALALVLLCAILVFTSCGNTSAEKEPVKLKMTYTNNKVSLKDSIDYSVDIKSLHMIKDTDGYNYLVLNYSVKNETNQKIEMNRWSSGIGSAKVVQNGTSLDSYHYLSRESEEAYADILTGSTLLPTELRPYEVRDITEVYEVYDLSSDITVMFSPISYVAGTEEQVSIVRRFSF